MTKAFVKPRYSALHFRQLRGYKTKTCPVCGRKFGPKVTAAGTLELRGSFEKRRACSDLCKSILIRQAHKERRGRVAATRKDAAPAQPSPPVTALEEKVTPASQSEVARKLGAVIDAKRSARKSIGVTRRGEAQSGEPKPVEASPFQTETSESPQSFYNENKPAPAVDSEIMRERAERVSAGTFDPTPDNQKIELDAPLRRALRKALLHHDPDFIECWEELEKASAASGRDPAPYPGVAAA